MRGLSCPWAALLSLALLPNCGGATSEAKTSKEVHCPEGQSYDGQFCTVDQNVATAETAIAPVVEPHSPGASSEKDELVSPSGLVPEGVASTDDPIDGSLPLNGQVGAVVMAEGQGDEPEEGAAVSDAKDSEPLPPKRATPVDITMAAQAAPIVQYLASSHLPSGARPHGAPFAGQFSEGQVLEQKVQLTEGRCYTVVAVAMHPIRELNILLYSEGSTTPVATDETHGPQAVLGSRDACYQVKESGSLNLVIEVERGQGVAAAQVFEK